MPRFVVRLLLLVLSPFFVSAQSQAQQTAPPPILSLGNAVVTGFSGTVAPDPKLPRPPQRSIADLTFINPEGASARILDLGRPGQVWDGQLIDPPKTLDILAQDVGQVFGIALDDQPAPNVYLSATSAFGLNLVRRGRDGQPERVKKGGPGVGWMKGQFGLELQGGPGAIYKVDGRTGVATLLANVTLDGVPNPGPGLGNLAYDAGHRQLFVSDLYTGMIHRFDLDGRELGRFDHGVTALTAARLAPVAFDPRQRPNIASPQFDSEKPATWGYAPAARRVWALALHQDRLYYSVASGPQIWSIGIARDGNFANDPRWEFDVPAQAGPLPVTDIAFSHKGAMLLAQRALVAGSYDYSAFTQPGEPRVFRMWLKGPNDPPSPGRWKPDPEEYAVGFAGTYRNSNGGIALGYGYGRDGVISGGACEYALWATGQNLRNRPELQKELEPGGPLVVHGLQGSPASPVRNFNEPPWVSYFVDYDGRFDDPRDTGHLGSVRIYTQPCAAVAAYGGPGYASEPPYIFVDGGCIGPDCRPPTPINLAIKKTAGGAKYDEKTGLWTVEFKIDVSNAGNPFAPGNAISISDPIPAGLTLVAATGTNWTCTPALPISSGTLNCGYAYGGGVFNNGASLNQLVLTFTAKAPGKYENCATVSAAPASRFRETTLADNRSCDTVEVKRNVDVAIEKTGKKVEVADMPMPDTTHFSYTLAITNVGMGFPGNQVITVSDTPPAGVTFTSVSSTSDWNCQLVGGAVQCTYIGTGPAAPGDALGSVTITAVAKGKGPWENCSTVAVDPTAGVDTNLDNNKSCVTLTGDGFVPHDPPPEVKPQCGMNVLFVVDESHSIAEANATWNVISALNNAASVLNNNGSKAALVRFSDNATLVYNWATATYSTLNTGYNPNNGGGTNWEAALLAAKNALPMPPSVVIFITDGVPTAYLDNAGTVQFTTDSVVATNEAIPVVNQIYGMGVPIIGIGIGSISTHLNALLGGNVHSTTYGGLSNEVTATVRELCPNLYLTKQISPNYINYFYMPDPQQVTVTLTVTNTTGAPATIDVEDALPPELTNPTAFNASPGSASGNPVNWNIPNLPSGQTATLTFKATVAPSGAVPTDGTWACYKNFAQVRKVDGVEQDASHLMANPVTGPVHEQDEASDQVCVQKHENPVGPDCGSSYLWVKKKPNFSEICRPGGTPACSFTITVQAQCKDFNGPVIFGDGVTGPSGPVNSTISSITNNASPPICNWSGAWTSTTTPSTCTTNLVLPVNQTITFTATMAGPLPPLPAGQKYTNCFVADGKTPTPTDYASAVADVNPTTAANGQKWGNCTTFNTVAPQGIVCPTGTTPQQKAGRTECLPPPPPPVCAPPMVPGPVLGQCICPQGTMLEGKECVRIPPPPVCRPPMVPGPVPGSCICPNGTALTQGKCVPTLHCRAPLVPDAAGASCVCSHGRVLRRGKCVEPVVCRPPAKLNRQGTGCDCPRGMERKGNTCVEHQRPGVTPNDVIRIVPGIIGPSDRRDRGGNDKGGPSPRGNGAGPGKP